MIKTWTKIFLFAFLVRRYLYFPVVSFLVLNLIFLVEICIYFKPENSPDKAWRTFFNCLLRQAFGISTVLREYHSSDLGIKFLRHFHPPNGPRNPDTTEEVVDFGNYQIGCHWSKCGKIFKKTQ